MGKDKDKDPRRELADAWADAQQATQPLERIDAVRRVRDAADALEHALVREARAAGVSWSRIGALYGLTKQGAQQRFRAGGETSRGGGKDGSAAKEDRDA